MNSSVTPQRAIVHTTRWARGTDKVRHNPAWTYELNCRRTQ
jgi:hypothetical protein